MKYLILVTVLGLSSLNASADTLDIDPTANDNYNAKCAVEFMPEFNDAGDVVKQPVTLTEVVINLASGKTQDILTDNGITYQVSYSEEKGVNPPVRYVDLLEISSGTKKVLSWTSTSFQTEVAPALYLQLEGRPQFFCMGIEIRNNLSK